MKLPKFVLLTALIFSFCPTHAQVAEIVGNWQLVKQSRCLDETADKEATKPESVRTESHTSDAASPGVVSFKTNSSGEESTRILNSAKTSNPKKFFYKFNGEMLLILDKRTQTISDSYLVDKFTADSLIISNASRPCETMIFVKITERTPN